MKSLFRGATSVPDGIYNSETERIGLLRRKAMDTRNIKDTCKYAEGILKLVDSCGGIKNISKSSWQRVNAKVWSVFESELFTWILMMVFHKQEENDKNWSMIFYECMAAGKTKTWNMVSPSLNEKYFALLSATMDCLPPDLQESAEQLCRYFECHQVDPYGCIIGQSPSKEIIQCSLNFSADSLKDTLKTIDVLHVGEVQKGKPNYHKQYEEILQRIVHWTTMDPESAYQHINQVASAIRGTHRLPRGSLVLVSVCGSEKKQNTSSGWRYARIAGKAEGALILLYLTPEENMVTSIQASKVIPLSPEMIKKYFSQENFLELSSCVETRADETYHKIMKYCGEEAQKYLASHEIGMEIIELAFKNMCTLSHHNDLKAVMEVLQRPYPRKAMENIQKHVETLIRDSIKAAHSELPFYSFQPSLESDCKELESFDTKSVFLKELKQYEGICQMGIENIQLQRLHILSGRRKKEIVDSWLRKIDVTVSGFLVKVGFECGAVPNDYLDSPPESISAVRRNLVLLRRVLKSRSTENDIFKVKDLIQTLCNSIYDTISRFLKNITHCIALTLSVPVDSLPSHSAGVVEMISMSSLGADVKEELIGLIKDQEYLINMKRMENDAVFASSQRMVTIPVSGLILSKLCRLENEHKSVLDLWEPALVLGKSFESPLEAAIMKNDPKQLAQVLKGGIAYVNEPDANGWTALHLSCSYLMNMARLESINFLLTFPETDTMMINNYGNTALHYYAHIPVVENIQTQYRDIFLKMIQKESKVIHITNLKGETPLHRASLSGNPVATRYLLENNADPNYANEDGATSLHYAVQSNNVECADVLMKFYANHTQPNIDGESPLDVAIKLNHDSLMELLSKEEWSMDKVKLAQTQATSRKRSNVTQVDRRSIYQSKNVPTEILDRVQSRPVNIPLATPSMRPKPIQRINSKRSPPEGQTETSELASSPVSPKRSPPSVFSEITKTIGPSCGTLRKKMNAMQRAGAEIINSHTTAQACVQNGSSMESVVHNSLPTANEPVSVTPASNSKHRIMMSEVAAQTKALRPVSKSRSGSSPTLTPPSRGSSTVVINESRRPSAPKIETKRPKAPHVATKLSSPTDSLAAVLKSQERTPRNILKPTTGTAEGTPCGPGGMLEIRIALWDVQAEASDEISFSKGDSIRVISKDPSGWWTGEVGGRTGTFPSNYTREKKNASRRGNPQARGRGVKPQRGGRGRGANTGRQA